MALGAEGKQGPAVSSLWVGIIRNYGRRAACRDAIEYSGAPFPLTSLSDLFPMEALPAGKKPSTVCLEAQPYHDAFHLPSLGQSNFVEKCAMQLPLDYALTLSYFHSTEALLQLGLF